MKIRVVTDTATGVANVNSKTETNIMKLFLLSEGIELVNEEGAELLTELEKLDHVAKLLKQYMIDKAKHQLRLQRRAESEKAFDTETVDFN